MKWPGKMAGEVLRHVGAKPATGHYPFVKEAMPARFRGRMIYHGEKCNGCKLCVRDCPSHALTINKVGDKQFDAVFDLDHCIYCAQCVDSCNKDAIEATPDFELAALSRSTLQQVFHGPPAPPKAVVPTAADPVIKVPDGKP